MSASYHRPSRAEPRTATPTATSIGAALFAMVFLGAFAAHAAARALHLPPALAAYVGAAFGMLGVVALERRWPYRAEWQPRRRELWTDLAFLVLVQVGVPVLLTAGIAAFTAASFAPHPWWPHQSHPVVQVLLLLLIADLLRYWLHVAAHRWPPLWRLHAVHHAPETLHALNVGRFHPLDKAVQYLADTLPFALLGVAPDVLALYLVFYATHGFFQHANVALQLGRWNWLFSGPELHRWHHSRQPTESAHNFGNNLILWDVLFGTRLLPGDRAVAELGVGTTESTTRSWRVVLLDSLFRLRSSVCGGIAYRRMLRAAANPDAAQNAVLRRILRANRDTPFGREHGFATISSLAEFRARVPLQDYESLRPHIDAGGLTREKPAYFAATSGTTGKPKHIPWLASSNGSTGRLQAIATYVQQRAEPGAFAGKILTIVGSAVEGLATDGTPYGSMSGQVYRAMSRLAGHKFVVPPQVFEVENYELQYMVILRLALCHADITLIGTANPSTLLRLQELLRAHRTQLLCDCERGTFTGSERLPDPVWRAVRSRLACTSSRRTTLRRILAQPNVTLADCWPNLRLINTWTGGSCGFAIAELRAALPVTARIAELGYLASELRGSINVDLASDRCLPTLEDVLFEFCEVDAWHGGAPRWLGLAEVQVGVDYHVAVTTPAGLYRYFMNDIVRITGRIGQTATIAFRRKGRGVTSITGEKLTECQVLEALQSVSCGLDVPPRFLVALADREQRHYHLLVEYEGAAAAMLGPTVDTQLAALSCEYRGKRASGRLGPLMVHFVRPGTADALFQRDVARGMRHSQHKPAMLQYADEFEADWRDWCCEATEQLS